MAAPDGGPAPDAGSTSCKTSDDCAPPTPYCNTALGQCVQCTSDLNCFGVGYVCNTARGVCALCNTNADCYGTTPYCSASLDRCVECVKDSNCGNQGIKCADGVCGSCGDGICSPAEKSGMLGLCSDCFGRCTPTDLKSKVGDKLASGTISVVSPDQIYTNCGPAPVESPSFTWTAPETGTYLVEGGVAVLVSVLSDTCAGNSLQCSQVNGYITLNAGDRVVIVVSNFAGVGSTPVPYTLSIHASVPSCDVAFCVNVPGFSACCTDSNTCGQLTPMGCIEGDFGSGGAGGAGGGPSISAQECLSRAASRGEPLCDQATTCSCKACPDDYDRCKTANDGCADILACIGKTNCVEFDCYKPDTCQKLVDAYGGVMGVAFQEARVVSQCDRNLNCQYFCPGPQVDASVGQGGAGGSGGGAGKGGRGSGGVPRSSGGATSDSDAGSDTRGKGTSSGGCGCSLPRGDASPWGAVAALAGLGIAVARRRRRHG
jgi:MYXO-CTERM domain-containing protein